MSYIIVVRCQLRYRSRFVFNHVLKYCSGLHVYFSQCCIGQDFNLGNGVEGDIWVIRFELCCYFLEIVAMTLHQVLPTRNRLISTSPGFPAVLGAVETERSRDRKSVV